MYRPTRGGDVSYSSPVSWGSVASGFEDICIQKCIALSRIFLTEEEKTHTLLILSFSFFWGSKFSPIWESIKRGESHILISTIPRVISFANFNLSPADRLTLISLIY